MVHNQFCRGVNTHIDIVLPGTYNIGMIHRYSKYFFAHFLIGQYFTHK